ncbi:MAG: hypothetical protein KVP17_001505 [Porospora cf. gigantea B]|uniref:uncharacterized protein n=1 Tax=Porospora cf. gigantea B TaxID=2853592 RepID=UPI003571D10C|nr:MAG: hypothetical protein KVP17_001505 [Porospora cf. gigantea B]
MQGIHIAVVCIARAGKLEGQWLCAHLRYGTREVNTTVVQVIEGVGKFYSAFNFAYEDSVAGFDLCDAVGNVLHVLELDFGNVSEEVQRLTITTPHGIVVVEYNQMRPSAISTTHVSVYIKSIEPMSDLPATTFRVHYGSDVQNGEAMPSAAAGQEGSVDHAFLFDFEPNSRVVVIDLFDLEDMNLGISAVDLRAPRPTVDRIAGKCIISNRDGVQVARVMVKVLFWDYDKAMASVEQVFHNISNTKTSMEGDSQDFSDMYEPLLLQAQNAHQLFLTSKDPVLRSVQVTILDRIMMRMEALRAAQAAGSSQKQTRAARLQVAALTRKYVPAPRRRRESMLQDVPEFEEEEPSLEDGGFAASKPAGLTEFEQARAMVEHTACEISKFCEAYASAVERRPAVRKYVDEAEEIMEVAGENGNVSFEAWLSALQLEGPTEILKHQQLFAEARLLVANKEAMCQDAIHLLECAEVLANSTKVKIVEKAVLPCRKVRYIRRVKVYHEKKKSAFDCCRPAYPNYSNVKLLGVEFIPTQERTPTDPVLFSTPSTTSRLINNPPTANEFNKLLHPENDTGDVVDDVDLLLNPSAPRLVR